MKKYISLFCVFTLVAMLLVTGCSQSSTAGEAVTKTQSKIKLGLIAPLTGEAASWGDSSLAGAKLAVAEINTKGGINGQKIQLFVEDDQCSSKGVNAMQKLINVDGVTAILGPVCSASAGPALPITQQNNIPTILVAASAPHLTSIGDNIFRVYPSDAFQGKEGAELLYKSLGKRKAALIYVKNDWGEGIQKVFKEEFEKLGGQVVYKSGVLQSETDFKTEITKIKNSGAEVLYFPVYPANAIAAFKQMEELGLDIPIVGSDTFGGDEVIKSGYGNGVIFALAKMDTPQSFEDKIHSIPGYETLEIFITAPLSYDAVYIMAQAIEKAGNDKDAIKAALRETKYAGVSNSLIDFDAVGDLKKVTFERFVIKNKKSVPYNG